jgi:hypothetical protein
MSLFLKLKCLVPGRRRHLEEEMREELESLAALAEVEGKRSDLGNLTLAAEEGRAVWSWNSLEQLAADIRYAGRTMKRNPGLVLIAVLSLGLGIGANTAVFGLMQAILLKPLPVHDPATLVVLTSYGEDGPIGDFGYGDYLAIRDGQRVFSGVLAASNLAPLSAQTGGESEETVQRKIVSGNYFSVLRVRPVVGQLFSGHRRGATSRRSKQPVVAAFFPRLPGSDRQASGPGWQGFHHRGCRPARVFERDCR